MPAVIYRLSFLLFFEITFMVNSPLVRSLWYQQCISVHKFTVILRFKKINRPPIEIFEVIATEEDQCGRLHFQSCHGKFYTLSQGNPSHHSWIKHAHVCMQFLKYSCCHYCCCDSANIEKQKNTFCKKWHFRNVPNLSISFQSIGNKNASVKLSLASNFSSFHQVAHTDLIVPSSNSTES